MTADNTLERILRHVDSVLGLDNIPVFTWLVSVLLLFLVLSLFSERARWRGVFVRRRGLITYLIFFLLGFSNCFLILALILSYFTGYYYNFYVVIGLVVQMTCLLITSIFWRSITESKKVIQLKKFLMHLSVLVTIFVVSGRWLIRGVDAEETSADTLSIFYAGNFQYSRHAGWYDLAPVDSLIKVMLLRVSGNNDPLSPLETFMISFASGLILYFLVYAYLKANERLHDLLPLTLIMLALHPYAFLPGASITPTNIAVSLALVSLLIHLRSESNPSGTHLITSGLLFAASVLAHPFALSALVFMFVCILAKYFGRSLKSSDIMFFVLVLVLWLVKAAFTATIYGIASVYESVVNGITQVWEREALIVFRSVKYGELPKLALASFSASLGIVGGVALITLYLIFKGRVRGSLSWLTLLIVFFAGFAGLSSALAALGGQSRYVFVPFAPLFFLVVLFFSRVRNVSSFFRVLILFAAILTLLSPNFIPDQYSFFMAAKTSDRVMFSTMESLFERLDPVFVADRFHGRSSVRLYIFQEGVFIRSGGESGLIVEKLILPSIINTRSYWNFVGRGPFDPLPEDYDYSADSIVVNTDLVRVVLSWISR